MCVIVAMPPGVRPSKEILRNCYDNNPDGWGIMYNGPYNGSPAVWTIKEHSSFDRFWEAFEEVPNDSTVGVHFRIRTHGPTNKDNCHPFEVNNGLWLMHNGVIPVETPNKSYSDTWHFVEHNLKALIGPEADCSDLEDSDIFESLRKFTTGSRLMFLDRFGNTLLTSESSWHGVAVNGTDKVFFSNSYSHIARNRPVSGYYGNTYRSCGALYDFSNDPLYGDGDEYIKPNGVYVKKYDHTPKLETSKPPAALKPPVTPTSPPAEQASTGFTKKVTEPVVNKAPIVLTSQSTIQEFLAVDYDRQINHIKNYPEEALMLVFEAVLLGEKKLKSSTTKSTAEEKKEAV